MQESDKCVFRLPSSYLHTVVPKIHEPYGVSAGCNAVTCLCKRFVTCFLKYCLPATEKATQSVIERASFFLVGFCLIGSVAVDIIHTEMVSKTEGWVFPIPDIYKKKNVDNCYWL